MEFTRKTADNGIQISIPFVNATGDFVTGQTLGTGSATNFTLYLAGYDGSTAQTQAYTATVAGEVEVTEYGTEGMYLINIIASQLPVWMATMTHCVVKIVPDATNTNIKPNAIPLTQVLYTKNIEAESIANIQSDTDSIESKIDIVDTIVDSIIEDTSTTIPAQITVVGDNVLSVLDDTNTTIPAQIAGVETKVDIIDNNVDSILGKMPTGSISELDLSTIVESGMTLGNVLSLVASMVDGRMTVDATTGIIKLYARDNTTLLSTTTTTTTERTRS